MSERWKIVYSDCAHYIETDKNYNYLKVIEGAENLRIVKFSVEATNDIHLSLSRADPLTPSNYEIVFGGWGGSKSVIRASHQGAELVSVRHTKAEFNQVETALYKVSRI